MMKNISRILLAAALVSLLEAKIKEHHCLPTGVKDFCVLEYIYYEEHDNTTHVFSKNYTHVFIHGRIKWGASQVSYIWRFDSKLYADLGQPSTVEVDNCGMNELEIPRTLQSGNFDGNFLKWFSVEHGDTEPALTYLDLSDNNFKNLTNITSLVNLQTLLLVGNLIGSLEPSWLTALTRLKVLNLNHNSLSQLSAVDFPSGLVNLQLYSNNIETLNSSDLSFPSLERLNLDHNRLKEIDAAAVVLAMPKLKFLLLGANHFTLSHIKKQLEVFRRHNVTYASNDDDGSCWYGLEMHDGICIRKEYVEKSWLAAVGLSSVAVIVAIGFVLLVRWTFILMNK